MATHHVQPTEYSRRGFHYRTLIEDGAIFHEVADAAVALNFGRSGDEETAQATKLGLADLSPLPRTGFKGRGSIEWLQDRGLEIGDENNRAWPQTSGGVVARLADTEALVLGDITGGDDLIARLNGAFQTDRPGGCYHVPRREGAAWFVVTGARVSEMLAKLCGVDLRLARFPSGSVAQTSLARMNVIAIRADLGGTPAFHLLFDSASADYLWGCLKDAMTEFDGMPVGHAALLSL